jgi:hypothetical protein
MDYDELMKYYQAAMATTKRCIHNHRYIGLYKKYSDATEQLIDKIKTFIQDKNVKQLKSKFKLCGSDVEVIEKAQYQLEHLNLILKEQQIKEQSDKQYRRNKIFNNIYFKYNIKIIQIIITILLLITT